MDLLATGSAVKPGLPARSGDAASDSEKADESATFEAFLGLALTVFSPDAVASSGPEGKPAPEDASGEELDAAGKPAMPPGNMLPVGLAINLEAIGAASLPDTPGDGAESAPPVAARSITQSVSVSPAPPEITIRALPIVSAPAAPAETASAELAAAKVADLLVRTEVSGKAAPAALPLLPQTPHPQTPQPQIAAAEALAVAHNATPIISVLAGRQRQSAEPVRLTSTPEASGDAAPHPADSIPSVQPPAAAQAARPEPARSPAKSEPADETAPQTSLAPPDPAAPPMTTANTSMAEPLAPFADARASQPAQPVAAAITPASQPQSAAQQFGDIVDRLARAREAEQPDLVRSTLATRDFGTVSMQLRPLEGRLHVSLTAADPGFAPAVQAASAIAGTGQQASSDNSAQSQQQPQGQSSQQSSPGQSALDSQTRRQQWERASQAQPQGPAGPTGNDNSKAAKGARGAASGGSIYA